MSQFRFELAGLEDDAALRRVLAATPMDGRISLRFLREPGWFAAAEVEGHWRQVVVCRSVETGEIIGFGSRSLRKVLLNGESASVGYLSSLRLLSEYRNSGLVPRGYAFFRKLHADGLTPFYLTTIASGNETALRILTSGRAGLPTYHSLGQYLTFAIPLLRHGRGVEVPDGIHIRSATTADLPTLIDFLKRAGQGRQFFPEYTESDFLNPTGRLRGLALEDVLLAERDGQVIGTLAGWDQSSYRQTMVAGYRGWLRWLRPLTNFGSRLVGLPPLPAPGEHVNCVTAALTVAADDDPVVWRGLIEAVRRRQTGKGRSHLLLGLHDNDPLQQVARSLASACYITNLYLVYWSDGAAAAHQAAFMPVPYLELGSL